MTHSNSQRDDTLLTADNHALLLIDHQYLQLLAVRSHPAETVVSNTTMLAKGAKIFNVPTLLTTAFAERQEIFQELQAVFPEQKPIDRTSLNSWTIRECANGSPRPARKNWSLQACGLRSV
ncbi:hypothetical protein IMF27_30520 [Pseudomonas sp. PCH199]|uniref:hypothetical protein n=1 Tax=unclassified Pseudomonas TaxID=196821 RepID=UPI000BC6D466|nr:MULTISPECIES: hypothetical protein [unclassified Pseudomonas]MCW8279247.1 hypothetical protein [Pseudomonas sp. PCH199]PAM78468.1 hypothetical protein CES87_31240 [Pseudomonas sp. ERMR1:02]